MEIRDSGDVLGEIGQGIILQKAIFKMQGVIDVNILNRWDQPGSLDEDH